MGIFVGSKSARASGGISTTTVGPYTVHAFTTTGANTFTPATTGFIDILLVGGGGGAGGYPNVSLNGGGGAGATLFRKMIPVTAGTPYPINVGTAGAGTTFTYSGITTTAFAGGAGSAGGNPITPAPRASGGGSGSEQAGGTGAGVYGIGFPGGASGVNASAGGGGAGGAGQNSPNTPTWRPAIEYPPQPGAGGPGVPIQYFVGISTIVCEGGGPGGSPSPGTYGSGRSASPLSPGSVTPGNPGVAYIRYM